MNKDTVVQKKLAGGLFQIQYQNRVFLLGTCPVKIAELDEPVNSVDELHEGTVELFTSTDEYAVTKDNSFRGFGAVEFIATTHCNLRCTHCTARDFDEKGSATYYGMEAEHMPLVTMKSALQQAIELLEERLKTRPVRVPVFEMFITGGEPLLVWDALREALTYARERLAQIPNTDSFVFTPHIVTNGTLIDSIMAEELKEQGTHVTIALDSPYSQVRVDEKGGAATPRAVAGLKQLVAVGHPNASVNVVIAGERLETLEETMAYLESIGAFEGITTIQLSPLAPPIAHTEFAAKGLSKKCTGFNDRAVCERFSDILIDYSQRYNLDMKGYGGKLGNWLKQGGTVYRCPVAEWKWVVSPNGDVFACHQLVGIEQFKMGNLLEEGWYSSPKAVAIRERFLERTVRDTDLCPDCALESSCMVFVDCPARSFLEAGHESNIVQHYCNCGKKYLMHLLAQHVVSLVDTGMPAKHPFF